MLKSDQKAKLQISEELVNKVTYLHRKINKLEWSGILLFSVEEGDIENPDSLVLKAQNFHVMDIGTSTYTEYDFGPEMFDMYEKYPEADPVAAEEKGVVPWKIGHIHTHHDMNAYFSGTDNRELEDNAPNHNYYLSLIVNYEGSYVAAIAIHTEVESSSTEKYTFKNSKGKKKSFNKKKKESSTEIIVVECEIEFEGQDDIDARIKEIEDSKPKYATRYPNDWDDVYPYKGVQTGVGSGVSKGTNHLTSSKGGSKNKNNDTPFKSKVVKGFTGSKKDISPYQTKLPVRSDLSYDEVRKFFVDLILQEEGISQSETVYSALTKISKYTPDKYEDLLEDIDQKFMYYFMERFPDTTTELDEVVDQCVKLLKVYPTSAEAVEIANVLKGWIFTEKS